MKRNKGSKRVKGNKKIQRTEIAKLPFTPLFLFTLFPPS